MFEDDPRANDPVGFFAGDQVADHVERAEGVVAVVGVRPLGPEAGEHGAQDGGRAFEDGNG